MQVAAVSTPGRPEWRWRIANYAGEVIEESRNSFGTIAAALAEHPELRAAEDAEPAADTTAARIALARRATAWSASAVLMPLAGALSPDHSALEAEVVVTTLEPRESA